MKNIMDTVKASLNEERIRAAANVFNEKALWEKLKGCAVKLGREAMLKVFTLYYILKEKPLAASEKALIVGALGYLLLPLDLVPDFLPVVGYLDDIFALGYVIDRYLHYVDDYVRLKAQEKLESWFGK
ncbi:MAG: DUF1232 domain-containing protein [Desulfovibrionaceae bacterium]|nr:DUF1232 domain-containing protein [Desulfovibrionaceae bacterium]